MESYFITDIIMISMKFVKTTEGLRSSELLDASGPGIRSITGDNLFYTNVHIIK
jgi:hypothetical protein